MSEGVLEAQRYALEELERLQQAIVDRRVVKPRTLKDQVKLNFQCAKLLDQVSNTSRKILSFYDSGKDINADNELSNFYEQLNSVRDFHQRHPDYPVEDLRKLYALKPLDENYSEVDTMFRGEEMYGRFFDLNECYEDYINLKQVPRLSYLDYISKMDAFDDIPKASKTQQYENYLEHLCEYLDSFYRRTHQLENVDKFISVCTAEFEAAWENGLLSKSSSENSATGKGIFCPFCQKYYSKQSVYDAHLNSKKHKKASTNATAEQSQSNLSSKSSKYSNISRLEFLIKRILERMDGIRQDTRDNVVRRQTLTASERLAEIEAAERSKYEPSESAQSQPGTTAEESDEENEEKIYNPLKLPLGWDGKPIPYWLWKLHGLGKEFPCEICGNYVYLGRKAFDKHFFEQRHIYGLKCLGITASPLLNQVTSIDEAVQRMLTNILLLRTITNYSVWQKIKQKSRKNDIDISAINEMEDDEGNVMSEKVYNDLKAQGLLS
ncbi:U2 snRNP-associated protein sap61 [Schizosaccharomyces japonicus yFS275]|uniref:U2 snRNP-associated protein sap61 n=1 Tax=Schizosaccharomyces japonicus (strain yFS275 / FY16936) TaxID=402676 RepID=B6JW10_SCHJY|nr:U2 snRNP-associated protein sap61 [Schizosaccharomyces japonicus yFS275]EEB05561.1 U2 snRNP-associated protein sap61 [Schizosaccharomyces japonicus yFS275]